MKNRASDFIPTGLALAEHAVNLLRRSGVPALVDYYIGSLPFALGLLYFWSDMSRNPMAHQYCGPSAAGLALLFVWMKYWQVRFCRRLTCCLQGIEPESWPLSRSLATLARQCALQATGVVVLPLAAVIALPLGWAYAFYQNATVLDDPRPKGVMLLGRSALRQSMLWPGQNHLFLSVISVFAIIVLVNLGITLIMLPNLIKSLLGVETVFTLSAWSLLNTTFFAVVCMLGYVCVDPILKAAYVLRCFHGMSLQTGADIRAALKPYRKTVLSLLLLAVCLSAAPARAQDEPTMVVDPWETVTNSGEYTRRLDRAIDQVLRQRRFAWRLPREEIGQDPQEQGWLASILRWIGDLFNGVFETLGQWFKALVQWLEKSIPKPNPREHGGGWDWRGLSKLVFYLLGLALVFLLMLGIRRWWRHRRPSRQVGPKKTAPQLVDLGDESVSAQDLPTDRWLLLGAELMESGDYRSALRAFYLSVISILADTHRVSPARFKSNQDYYHELAQREHAEPEVLRLFQRCMRAFERAWYGMHPVSKDLLERFTLDQKRIHALVRPTI